MKTLHYHREDREEFVRYLADKFPKCFFENPDTRLPLKHDIGADLEKQKVLDPEKITQAIQWYTNSFGYMRHILSGAERIDLDGNKAGTVTFSEQETARKLMQDRKRILQERKELQQREIALAKSEIRVAPPATLEPVKRAEKEEAEIAPVTHTISRYQRERSDRAQQRRQALIDLARNNSPITVKNLVTLALNNGVSGTRSSLCAQIYSMTRNGDIAKSWVKSAPRGGDRAHERTDDLTGYGTPHLSIEHLHAQIALFEAALTSSPNKMIAKALASGVARTVIDEMRALVKGL